MKANSNHTRSAVQAEVAREADRLRVVRADDIDQHDIARAIEASNTHVQHCLSARERPTFTLADVVLLSHSDDPALSEYGGDLIRWLAERCGFRVERADVAVTSPLVPACEVAAAGGALARDVAAAMADGTITAAERRLLEPGLRAAETAVATTRAALRGVS